MFPFSYLCLSLSPNKPTTIATPTASRHHQTKKKKTSSSHHNYNNCHNHQLPQPQSPTTKITNPNPQPHHHQQAKKEKTTHQNHKPEILSLPKLTITAGKPSHIHRKPSTPAGNHRNSN